MVKKHVKPRKMGDPGGIIESAGRDVCLQGHGYLPPLQQADPRRP